jgi:hypothetical protein
MQTRQVVSAGVAALTFACVFSLVAINERAARSPATVLSQAGPQYQALPRYIYPRILSRRCKMP